VAIVTLSDYMLQKEKSDDDGLIRDRILAALCTRSYKKHPQLYIRHIMCRQTSSSGDWLISSGEYRGSAGYCS
jgi:hypothetical protein